MSTWRVYRNGSSIPTKAVKANDMTVKERVYWFVDNRGALIAAFPVYDFYVLKEV